MRRLSFCVFAAAFVAVSSYGQCTWTTDGTNAINPCTAILGSANAGAGLNVFGTGKFGTDFGTMPAPQYGGIMIGQYGGGAIGELQFLAAASALGYGFRLHGYSGDGSFRIDRRANSATWSDYLTITPGGLMGIGTMSPTSSLTVVGGIESTTGGFKFPDGSVQTSAFPTNGTGKFGTDFSTMPAPQYGGIMIGQYGGGAIGELQFLAAASGPGFGFRLHGYSGDGSFRLERRAASATWSDYLTITTSGFMGIGTMSPGNSLHVYTTASADGISVDGPTAPAMNFRNAGTTKAYIGLATGPGQFFADAVSGDLTLRSETSNILLGRLGSSSALAIVGTSVGVGTTAPTERLMVSGNIRATGNISADGTIFAKYQDVAEWVAASGELAPATVVVLDPAHDNQVMASQHAYDTAVAGVVSESPGVVLGAAAAGKEKIATTGRVKVNVDATRAPVAIGDLLVTSDVPGFAMKSEPIDVGGAKIHRPGTVIGKALQPLPGGRGEILVLLSLQ